LKMEIAGIKATVDEFYDAAVSASEPQKDTLRQRAKFAAVSHYAIGLKYLRRVPQPGEIVRER